MSSIRKSIDEKDTGLAPSPSVVAIEPGAIEQQSSGDLDIAARFLANLDPSIRDEPISAKEARAVLWKIDLYILPVLAITIIVSAIDKVIISNASIYGLLTDNHMNSAQFSWIASIFYFAYLVFEMPGMYLAQKLPIRTFFASAVFGFAALTFCTGATSSFASLSVVRFIRMLYPHSPSVLCLYFFRFSSTN